MCEQTSSSLLIRIISIIEFGIDGWSDSTKNSILLKLVFVSFLYKSNKIEYAEYYCMVGLSLRFHSISSLACASINRSAKHAGMWTEPHYDIIRQSRSESLTFFTLQFIRNANLNTQLNYYNLSSSRSHQPPALHS